MTRSQRKALDWLLYPLTGLYRYLNPTQPKKRRNREDLILDRFSIHDK